MEHMPDDLVAAAEALRKPGGRRKMLPPGECAYCDRERASGNAYRTPLRNDPEALKSLAFYFILLFSCIV
jgi:hypothetical protein